MAAGEVVAGLSQVSTALTFQPAATVSVLLTFISNNATTNSCAVLIDGAGLQCEIPIRDHHEMPFKIFIDNSIYLHNMAATAGGCTPAIACSCFSGIEVE